MDRQIRNQPYTFLISNLRKMIRVSRFCFPLIFLWLTLHIRVAEGRRPWEIPMLQKFNHRAFSIQKQPTNKSAGDGWDSNDDSWTHEKVKTRQLSRFRRDTFDNESSMQAQEVATEATLIGNHRRTGKHHACEKSNDSIYSVQNISMQIPTPWPINVIKERWSQQHESSEPETNNNSNRPFSSYPSMGALFLSYAKTQAQIGFRQFSEVSAQLWYNLPPAAPPLILFASIPRSLPTTNPIPRARTAAKAASDAAIKRVIPVVSNPFARSMALAGLGMAVLSWGNQELQRKRKLTPLPLPAMSKLQGGEKGKFRVSSVFLPPFLPEDVPEPDIDALLGTAAEDGAATNHGLFMEDVRGSGDSLLPDVSPKIRKHLESIYETTTTKSRRFLKGYYSDWLQGRAARKREVAKIRRNQVFDELLALQALKKRQTMATKKSKSKADETNQDESPELGFALVTGASRGIGRAIAVELARWEIPMVLVARDGKKLAKLASDLEACYGVKCCVLEADLSKTDAAEKIKQTTDEAGISVDILINNAGIAAEGLAVDAKPSDIESMIMLNALSYTKLSTLYGLDMKKKQRGRILMMSSMAGLCNGAPNTAVYGACKAFGKSLALSMAKEMERYGVGVTCLMPGAVYDTDFRASSGTHKAFIWRVPFYSRAPDVVAHQGVVSLLDGDTRSIPGWQNRVFANIVRPIIPQRVEIMLVQLAFSPLRFPSVKRLWQRNNDSEVQITMQSNHHEIPKGSPERPSSWLPLQPRFKTQPPPRFLKLPEDEPEQSTATTTSNDNEVVSSNDESTEVIPSPTTFDIGVEKNSSTASATGDDSSGLSESPSPPTTTSLGTSIGNKSRPDQFDKNIVDGRSERPQVEAETQYQQLPNRNVYDSSPHRTVEDKTTESNRRERQSNKWAQTESHTQQLQRNQHLRQQQEQREYKRKPEEEQRTEGIAIERLKRAKTPLWFDEDDAEDDFSTTLGPINTIESNRDYVLPKQNNVKREASPVIIV